MPAHPKHKEMLMYAQDAAETDKPWERRECQVTPHGQWMACRLHKPGRNPQIQYCRKPAWLRYRVGLFRSPIGLYYTFSYNDVEESREDEKTTSVVKWLTDWQEVELP